MSYLIQLKCLPDLVLPHPTNIENRRQSLAVKQQIKRTL